MIPSAIAIHTLSDCDSVTTISVIGKVMAFKATTVHSLKQLGNVDANMVNVFIKSNRFIAWCYEQNEISSSKIDQIVVSLGLVYIPIFLNPYKDMLV